MLILRIDHISAKYFESSVPVIAIYLTNIINLSINNAALTSTYKIEKIKPLIQEGIKSETKNRRSVFLLQLSSEVMEKSSYHEKQHQGIEPMHICWSGFRITCSTANSQ